MNKPNIEDTIAYFRTLEPHWTTFLEFIKEERESCYADIRRNTLTPQCHDRVYFSNIGQMVAYDNLLEVLRNAGKASDTK